MSNRIQNIEWGMIGCGDVTEIKSGPAFQRSQNSQLKAVMCRHLQKAQDYAIRHQVPEFYDEAAKIINHPSINAIYIATPPSSHLDYALQALKAGKMVYLEKPMVLNLAQAKSLEAYVKQHPVKITIAHYRRMLPAFQKIKELLKDKVIGEVRFVDLKILQPAKPELVASAKDNWRINPAVSGGGYFYDLAPHQLDLMYHYFGEPEYVMGKGSNQSGAYKANDIVNGIIHFEKGVIFQGIWAFNVDPLCQEEKCTIYGEKGKISFSFYGREVKLFHKDRSINYHFDSIPHIQQPMIQATIDYFLGKRGNPCSVEEATKIMALMEIFSQKH